MKLGGFLSPAGREPDGVPAAMVPPPVADEVVDEAVP